jgi:hypothetical protein
MPIDAKTGKAPLLQRVPYVVAGFDPKQTFIHATRPSGGKIEFGNGFGVRGVESMDVAGIAEMCVGDAKSQKAEGADDGFDQELLDKILEAFLKGGTIEIDASKLNAMRLWDPKGRVLLTTVRNHGDNPASVPRFARGLKARGARAVVLIGDRGAAATSGAPEVTRRDRYRRPPAEEPPALFLTQQAAKKLGDWAGVPIDLILSPEDAGSGALPRIDQARSELRVSVRYRSKDLDLPNVLGRLPGTDPSEAVLVSAPAGGSGHTAAALLAATKVLATIPAQARRPILLVVHSRPELQLGGHDWFLGHPPIPLAKIVAAVHLGESEGPGEGDVPAPGAVQLLKAKRASQDLEVLAAEAFRANGLAPSPAGKCPNAQRAVDAYAARGIPAIGLLATGETIEDGMMVARVAGALARTLADRDSRPSAPR